ncbi:MAG: hypothetical protein K9G59_07105 [Caulobacter sp.]|nr:hypothetical protein [Caulobacter sp.]
MTDVTSTPPALRWVALFLAACGVLGLFLGFRDQIRKNPPGWYTGVEQVAVPLTAPVDGAREAVAFDPSDRSATPAPSSGPAPKATETRPAAEETDAADTPTAAESTIAKPIVPPPAPLAVPPATPRPKATPAPKTAPSADPVGDILEGQKQPETPATVPY